MWWPVVSLGAARSRSGPPQCTASPLAGFCAWIRSMQSSTRCHSIAPREQFLRRGPSAVTSRFLGGYLFLLKLDIPRHTNGRSCPRA